MNWAEFGTKIGQGAIGGAIDTGYNMLNNYLNTQLYSSKEEEAAQNAFGRKVALTEMYNTPKAQVRMLKQAGLSPSTFYAGGGGQGTSVADAPQGGGAPAQGMPSLGLMQQALTAAQIENVKANTKNTEADTENKQQENLNLKQTFEKGIEEISNLRLKNAYQEYANTLEMLDVQLKASTIEQQIDSLKFIRDELEQKAKTAKHLENIYKNQSEISDETKKAEIAYKKQQVINLAEDTLLKIQKRAESAQLTEESKQRVEESKAKIDKIFNDIEVDRHKVGLDAFETIAEGFNSIPGINGKAVAQELYLLYDILNLSL